MSIDDFGFALLKRAIVPRRMSSWGLADSVQYDATPLPPPLPPPAPVWVGPSPPQAARAMPAGTPRPTSLRKFRRDVFIGSISTSTSTAATTTARQCETHRRGHGRQLGET